jgi:hypothetical protein
VSRLFVVTNYLVPLWRGCVRGECYGVRCFPWTFQHPCKIGTPQTTSEEARDMHDV